MQKRSLIVMPVGERLKLPSKKNTRRWPPSKRIANVVQKFLFSPCFCRFSDKGTTPAPPPPPALAYRLFQNRVPHWSRSRKGRVLSANAGPVRAVSFAIGAHRTDQSEKLLFVFTVRRALVAAASYRLDALSFHRRKKTIDGKRIQIPQPIKLAVSSNNQSSFSPSYLQDTPS